MGGGELGADGGVAAACGGVPKEEGGGGASDDMKLPVVGDWLLAGFIYLFLSAKTAPKLRVTNPAAPSKTLGVTIPASGRLEGFAVAVGDGFAVAVGEGEGDLVGVGLGDGDGLFVAEGVDSKEGDPSWA